MTLKGKIAFIGSGRMAEAIISGIIRNKLFKKSDIFATDKDQKRLKYLSDHFGIKTLNDNIEAVLLADIIVLAVKPQVMNTVLDQIKSSSQSNHLFISIAAGIPIKLLEDKLPGCSVIRTMPNNPCLVGQGITALSKGKNAGSSDLKIANSIFDSLGKTILVDEKYMDAVTGLSGSGPAFVYAFLESLMEGGVKAGLSKEVAKELADQTVQGAIATVIETKKTYSELSDMVASPGGTTIEGLKVLEEARFGEIVSSAVIAASQRAQEIRKEFGNS